jgi:hypothetical protein
MVSAKSNYWKSQKNNRKQKNSTKYVKLQIKIMTLMKLFRMAI